MDGEGAKGLRLVLEEAEVRLWILSTFHCLISRCRLDWAWLSRSWWVWLYQASAVEWKELQLLLLTLLISSV
jgi:hypothetical protein